MRLVAVRVVLAHHLADDRGALAERARRRQAHLAHRVEDPAMDRLEAVAHVRQGARDDDAHRVIEVRDAHLVLDADGSDVAHVVGHVWLLLRSGQRGFGWWMGSGRPPKRAAVVAAAEVDGAPRACGSRRGERAGSSASSGASLERLSRTTHARWPSSVLDGEVGLAPQGGRRRGRVALRQRSIGPGERLLDVGLGVAHQLVEEPEARSGPAPGRGRCAGCRGSSSRSSSR